MFPISRFSGARWAVLIALGSALAVNAQQAAAPSAPAPGAPAARPAASAPAANPLSYRSALEGYQPFADPKPVPWREANDNVGRIGGWRAYANEAQGTAPAGQGQHSGHGKP